MADGSAEQAAVLRVSFAALGSFAAVSRTWHLRAASCRCPATAFVAVSIRGGPHSCSRRWAGAALGGGGGGGVGEASGEVIKKG